MNDTTNPLDHRLKINEIFHSIQGESSLAGERFSFIRLSGCPLRCSYCDTQYAYYHGTNLKISEILKEINDHQTNRVLITGGEPLAQPNTFYLLQELNNMNKMVSIETSGEEDVRSYIGKAKIILDIKTPGSNEKADQCFVNLNYLLSSDEVKFVICSHSDYEWAKQVLKKYDLTNRFIVHFSAAYQMVEYSDLANWILNDKINVRMQLQIHKIIWPNETKGY